VQSSLNDANKDLDDREEEAEALKADLANAEATIEDLLSQLKIFKTQAVSSSKQSKVCCQWSPCLSSSHSSNWSFRSLSPPVNRTMPIILLLVPRHIPR
jgi:hypothetical protein